MGRHMRITSAGIPWKRQHTTTHNATTIAPMKAPRTNQAHYALGQDIISTIVVHPWSCKHLAKNYVIFAP